jgi:hypothetical protein
MHQQDSTLDRWDSGSPCERHETAWCADCSPHTAQTATAATSKPAFAQPPVGATRRLWSPDELDVLVALYFSLPFFAGDDSQHECQTMAYVWNRSASAVDRQWRNIQDVTRGNPVQHVGAEVKKAVERYVLDEAAGRRKARNIMTQRGWSPLLSLLQ